MTTFLPEEFKIKVKERLRDARFMAREMRSQAPRVEADGSAAGDHKPTVAGLTRTISEFSDNALQKLETVAIGLLSSDPQAHFSEARAYPLGRYRRTGHESAQAMFARDAYFAAKQILRGMASFNPRVSEELFAIAHGLAAREWDRAADPREDAEKLSLDAIAHDAAILAQAIVRARPVRAPLHFDGDADGRLISTSVYVASAIGLATAVATYHRDTLSADDPVYSGVCAAVDARYGVLEKAIARQDQPEQLARVFADLIPHLP